MLEQPCRHVEVPAAASWLLLLQRRYMRSSSTTWTRQISASRVNSDMLAQCDSEMLAQLPARQNAEVGTTGSRRCWRGHARGLARGSSPSAVNLRSC